MKILVSSALPKAIEIKLQALAAKFGDLNLEIVFNRDLSSAGSTGNKELLRESLENYDIVVPTVTDDLRDLELVAGGVRCKLLANFGVGYNHIDVNKCTQLGIKVTNTPGVLTDATADLTMTLLLMTARQAGKGERIVRSKQWKGWSPTSFVDSSDVTGKTLGIVGFGRIGQAVAKRAHHGFGMKILYTKPTPAAQNVVDELNAIRCDTIEELLPQCDFVSLNCIANASTKHLINEKALKLMKPTAILINTARGDIIDTSALISALQQGIIHGAGLDVYENEPNLDDRLLQIDDSKLVLLPHLGSATKATREAMGQLVLNNIESFLLSFDGNAAALPNAIN